MSETFFGPIRRITREAFAPFGEVLEHIEKTTGFEIIVRETAPTGWRLAVLTIEQREVPGIEKHPTSKESFEPVSGTTLLLVAELATPDNVSVFLLDKPICLHANIWHGVIALSERSVVKITENLDVTGDHHPFGGKVSAGLFLRK